ncbi:MAG: DUF2480 family protein [Bacteroidota bacterium]
MEEIVNKVAKSGLITIDLEELHVVRPQLVYDIKDNLFQGVVLKEKDFRDFIKTHDWSQYQEKDVAITCTTDAIIPTWAYMLLTAALSAYAHYVTFGTLEDLNRALFSQTIEKLDVNSFIDKRVVIKGCSKIPVPTSAYVTLTHLLKPVVASLMYGEPCSTVPVYKKKRAAKQS